ncbi:MAG: hypothetical protein GX630_02855 [Actinobacteria bacterium]|nr:hypothetical protein [Actinomycetota bacterium]
MRLDGSNMLREATEGCRAVLLCATDAEAEPVRAALRGAQSHLVATKSIHVGGLPVDVSGARAGVGDPTVRVALGVSGCDKANAAHLLTCLLQAMTPAPRLVVQFGIGGAFPSAGPGPGAGVGDIVVATHEIYSDTGSSSPEKWLSAAELGLPIAQVDGVELGGTFPLDVDLALAATGAMEDIDWSDIAGPEFAVAPEDAAWPTGVGRPNAAPAVLMGTCLTASRVTGLRGQAEQAVARWGALAESMEGAAAAHVCTLYRVPFLEIRGISNIVVDRDRASWQVERAIAVAGRATLAVMRAADALPLAVPEGAA